LVSNIYQFVLKSAEMRFLTIIAIICAMAVRVLCQDQTTSSSGYYWDPNYSISTTSYPYWADTTTPVPNTLSPPCDKKIQGPCGKLPKGAQKMYFFY